MFNMSNPINNHHAAIDGLLKAVRTPGGTAEGIQARMPLDAHGIDYATKLDAHAFHLPPLAFQGGAISAELPTRSNDITMLPVEMTVDVIMALAYSAPDALDSTNIDGHDDVMNVIYCIVGYLHEMGAKERKGQQPTAGTSFKVYYWSGVVNEVIRRIKRCVNKSLDMLMTGTINTKFPCVRCNKRSTCRCASIALLPVAVRFATPVEFVTLMSTVFYGQPDFADLSKNISPSLLKLSVDQPECVPRYARNVIHALLALSADYRVDIAMASLLWTFIHWCARADPMLYRTAVQVQLGDFRVIHASNRYAGNIHFQYEDINPDVIVYPMRRPVADHTSVACMLSVLPRHFGSDCFRLFGQKTKQALMDFLAEYMRSGDYYAMFRTQVLDNHADLRSGQIIHRDFYGVNMFTNIQAVSGFVSMYGITTLANILKLLVISSDQAQRARHIRQLKKVLIRVPTECRLEHEDWSLAQLKQRVYSAAIVKHHGVHLQPWMKCFTNMHLVNPAVLTGVVSHTTNNLQFIRELNGFVESYVDNYNTCCTFLKQVNAFVNNL